MIDLWTRVLTMAPASRRDASEAPESMHVIVVIDAGDACVTAATAAVSLAVWDDGTAMVMVSWGWIGRLLGEDTCYIYYLFLCERTYVNT